MNEVKEYIESGILEMYVLGEISPEDAKKVERMAEAHEEIRKEIEEIHTALRFYAEESAVAPHPTMKPFVMAVIDYSERINNGEAESFPPMLNENSRIEEYKQWLDREDMILPSRFENMFAKIIGHEPKTTTAILWIRSIAPQEVHENEYEKFLVVEGSCDITIGEKIHSLIAGDYIEIPLYTNHEIKITSDIPCKVILQRAAA